MCVHSAFSFGIHMSVSVFHLEFGIVSFFLKWPKMILNFHVFSRLSKTCLLLRARLQMPFCGFVATCLTSMFQFKFSCMSLVRTCLSWYWLLIIKSIRKKPAHSTDTHRLSGHVCPFLNYQIHPQKPAHSTDTHRLVRTCLSF